MRIVLAQTNSMYLSGGDIAFALMAIFFLVLLFIFVYVFVKMFREKFPPMPKKLSADDERIISELQEEVKRLSQLALQQQA